MAHPATIVILGPTASGKSALAVELARKLDGEVISADSRQVYKGLTLGTGKITKAEMKGVPHHLLDTCSASKVFTAGDFVRLGQRALADIHARGKVAIICGGTGFYIDALLGRITLSEVDPDPVFRKKLSIKTAAQLFALLTKKDPARARQMDTPSERNNPVRLMRALEVASAKSPRESATSRIPASWLGIAWPQDKLDKRIAKRLAARLRSGMIAEARRLHAGGLSYKRMESLGLEYRSLARFLRGTITRDELESELNHDIRRYSKKQMMYWKRNTDIRWIQTPVTTAKALRAIKSTRPHIYHF